MSLVLKDFMSDTKGFSAKFAQAPWIGDQAMTEWSLVARAQTIHYWQDIMPDNYLVNWTMEPESRRAEAHLAWWTDSPKPHEICDPLIERHW